MTTPTTTTETKLPNVGNLPTNLKPLATRAAQLHEDASKHASKAIVYACQCGHLLGQAREACAHGEWMTFIDASQIPYETARRYMGVAKAYDPDGKVLIEGKSLADLYRALGYIKPAAGGGNRLGGEELARRREADQLTFHYTLIEDAFAEVTRYAKVTGHTNPFQSLDSETLAATREQLTQALALVEDALAAN